MRKKALEHEKAKTLSKRGISLDLFGKTSYARLFDRNGLDEIRYLAGIELGTHLLDGGKTATRLEVNRLDSLLQDLGENQITQETENELRVDFKALQAAKVGIPVRKSHVRLARSLLLDSEADFDRGQIAKAHLLDRRISYRQAVLNYYQALESFMLSKLRLFQTLGRLDVGLFG